MWIYGINPVLSVIDKRPRGIKELVLLPDFNEDIRQQALQNKIKVTEGKHEDILARMGFKTKINHQKVFADIEPIAFKDLKKLINSDGDNVFLILDGVTDPHNLGAIIRTASAFGINAIILPKDRSASIDATVYKTSSGEVENINICTEVNLTRTITELKNNNFWIYGIEADSQKIISQVNLKGNICCVLGGEDTGIRRLIAKNCDDIFAIPMHSKAHSLNVSVAAAVFMYEIKRQKRFSF